MSYSVRLFHREKVIQSCAHVSYKVVQNKTYVLQFLDSVLFSGTMVRQTELPTLRKTQFTTGGTLTSSGQSFI